MARPQKEGMDYFPHDTDAVSDEKTEALRALYGNDGYAFYFILLERIYRTSDFEIDISDAETIQILARKIAVTPEKFNQILATALKWGCFDREAYEKRYVLTSQGIKKRASIVVKKREEMREKYHTSKAEVSDAETNQETYPETPQSKGKERKEKSTTPYQQIVVLYNEICVSLPRVKAITENRCKKLHARWTGDIEIFRELFTQAERSEFLRGNNDRHWKADFDWLINEQNMAKVLEGKYSNKKSNLAHPEGFEVIR